MSAPDAFETSTHQPDARTIVLGIIRRGAPLAVGCHNKLDSDRESWTAHARPGVPFDIAQAAAFQGSLRVRHDRSKSVTCRKPI